MFRRRPSDESGQVAVEFALVLPVLCLILFGVMKFGLVFFNYIDLTSAARDGARKASISRNDANAGTAVKGSISSSTTVVKDSNTTVTLTPAPPWASGTDVTVQVTYPYTLNVMGVNLWNGPMKAQSVVRIE
jgi:Flp pilus assembly protein TadG